MTDDRAPSPVIDETRQPPDCCGHSPAWHFDCGCIATQGDNPWDGHGGLCQCMVPGTSHSTPDDPGGRE